MENMAFLLVTGFTSYVYIYIYILVYRKYKDYES